jgi:hypothetical protein
MNVLLETVVLRHYPLALLQHKNFNAFFLLGMSKSLGLMILLVHHKICWRILNFAGADFKPKVAPAKDLHQQNSAGTWREPENTITPW